MIRSRVLMCFALLLSGAVASCGGGGSSGGGVSLSVNTLDAQGSPISNATLTIAETPGSINYSCAQNNPSSNDPRCQILSGSSNQPGGGNQPTGIVTVVFGSLATGATYTISGSAPGLSNTNDSCTASISTTSAVSIVGSGGICQLAGPQGTTSTINMTLS